MLLLIAVQVIIAKKDFNVGNTFLTMSQLSNPNGTICINTNSCYEVELLSITIFIARFDYKEC